MDSARGEIQLSLSQVVHELLNRLRGLHSFVGGVHPPESKDATRGLPIRPFPFAPELHIPLSQHIGKAAKPVVREGQEVVRGQLLAEPDGFMSVAYHAPASGTIARIGLMASVSGNMVEGIYLKPFPGSTQEITSGQPCRVEDASPEEIIKAIQHAGIVGLGGAAFPTHVKLNIPSDRSIDTLIINGAECEPYLTNDHRVMLEHQVDILKGIRYLLKATGARRAIIGIEANKSDAAEWLKLAIEDLPDEQASRVSVGTLLVKYPQGAEKMLIEALLHRQVPAGGLPSDVGVVVINVSTAAEIGHLLPIGQGIQERVITISGPGVEKPGNYRIPIGTPLRFALEYVGAKDDVSQVYLGGPMMGAALPDLEIPITKGSSGFVAFTHVQTVGREKESPCIRCAYCVDACPMFLNPAQLGLLARNQQVETMVTDYNLMDCMECGACSFVCPAHIPLVQYFRGAKGMYKRQQVSA